MKKHSAACKDCQWTETGMQLGVSVLAAKHNRRKRHHVTVSDDSGGIVFDWEAPPADENQGDEPPF